METYEVSMHGHTETLSRHEIMLYLVRPDCFPTERFDQFVDEDYPVELPFDAKVTPSDILQIDMDEYLRWYHDWLEGHIAYDKTKLDELLNSLEVFDTSTFQGYVIKRIQ